MLAGDSLSLGLVDASGLLLLLSRIAKGSYLLVTGH